MQRELYPNIKDFKKIGLTDYQIKQLIELEDIKHYFRFQSKHITHYSTPNSIFFLDIKDTLYHSHGHDVSGVLGKSNDSLQIFIRDVLALGILLNQTIGQSFTMSSYCLNEDNSSKIIYDFPTNIETAKYKMDIPVKQMKEIFTGKVINLSNSGPYKIVFISSDSIDVQKNIILFLLLIYKIHFACASAVYFNKEISWIDSQEIVNLEKLFEKSHCDYNTFIKNLPLKYANIFDEYSRKEIENILNNITFLSTKNSNLNKGELMKKFLDEYNIKNGLNYDDYNIFACGDSYDQDGPMIKLAFQLGGYGCINKYSFISPCRGETIRNELLEYNGIETRLPLDSYGFYDFYNKVIDYISLQRTWDLAETMQDINDKEKTLILNRFKKTNHYIKITK